MHALVALAYLVAAAISLAISVAAWRRRPAPGAFGLAILCFAHFGWSATYAAQWVFTAHEPSAAWYLVRLTWLQATPTAMLVFVLDFTGRTKWLNPRTVALLLVQPVAVLVLAATDRWHGLYLAGAEPGLVVTKGGPAFALNAAYSYALIALCGALLATRLTRRHPYRSQTALVLVAVMLPFVHFVMQVAGLIRSGDLNTVPFAFTVAGAIEWYALTRLGLFRVVPIARDQLIEQMPVGIVVFDPNRRIVDINPAALALTNARMPCIGKTADEAFPEHAETIARIRAERQGGGAATIRAPHSGGGMMEVTASDVVDRSGRRVATLVSLRDVTAEVEAVEKLAARSERLAATLEESERILSAMTDGVLLIDADARVLRDNPAARRILGGRRRSLVGRPLDDLLAAADGRELLESARTSGGPVGASSAMPDGRVLSYMVVPLRAAVADESQAIVIVRDETDRVAAERMQRELIANVSHELQTPLTALSLLASTIARAMRDDPSKVPGFLERLERETKRLSRLSHQLTMLSRVESSATARLFERLDMSAIVADEVSGAEHLAAAKQQSMAVDIEPSVAVTGDEAGLRAIVANLVGNAVRYAAEGGTIAVRLHTERDAEGETWAVLEVEDDGPGIPPEHVSRIFDRFYRIDSARSTETGGTGLGLSVVRQAAEQHGGTATVISVSGRGSCFTVRLPAEAVDE